MTAYCSGSATDDQEAATHRNLMQYAAAVKEATALYPGDPDRAASWVPNSFALSPLMAEVLKREGQRELGALNSSTFVALRCMLIPR